VATVVDNTKIIVSGSVAEQAIASISMGDSATAKLVTGQEVTGTIRYIEPVADERTRTFQVELEVPNPDRSLPAGVTAEMQLRGVETMAHKVSPALLSLDSEGNIGVKTVDQFDRVQFNNVEIVRAETNGVWVSGLPEDGQVITMGQGFVSAGQQVEAVYGDGKTSLAAEKTQ
jgi:multidrug efflux system membrane fusion protein